MANVFDNEVVLEAGQGLVVFRDFVTGVDLLRVFWYPLDPNGVISAPLGSIVSGAAGAWINIDGASAWAALSGGGGGGPWVQIGAVVALVLGASQVGIGTAAPLAGTKLDVVDTAGLTGGRYSFGVDRFFRIGSADAFLREQLWFTGTDSILRLGADVIDGDPFNANSEGIVVYHPAGDQLSRIKADRFGLSRATDSSLYYYRVDQSNLFYSADPTPGPIYPAGSVWWFVNRATGFVGVGNTVSGAGFPVPFGTEIFRVQGDTRIDGKLTVTGLIDPLAVILSDPAAGTALYYESFDGQTALVSGATTGRLRYNNATGTWQASVQGGAYFDLLTSLSATTFVFRPGGVASATVYPTFAPLYAAMSAVQGPKILQIDDSIVSPAVIPAGIYDFSDVTVVGLLSQTSLTFAAGVTVTEWFASIGFLYVDSLGAGPLVSYVGGGARNHDFHGTTLASSNLMFQVGAGANVYLNFDDFSYITPGPQIRAAGGTVAISLFTGSGLAPNSLSDDGVTATYVNYDAGCFVTAVQPAATTPPTFQRIDDASRVQYTPGTATDWAPAPGTNGTEATLQVAVDQLVRNGAGHFQKARDPLNPPPVYPAFSIHVETTGDDYDGDGTLAFPFASLARALQSIPQMPENTAGFTVVQFGAGVFQIPTYIKSPPNCAISGVDPTAQPPVATYLVDGVTPQPVNTLETGNRIVLDTLALAATVPAGTFVNLAATTTPGGALLCEVQRSDNSGTGGRLVLWVLGETDAFLINVAVGTTVDIVAPFTTIFEYKSGSVIENADMYYIHHRCPGGALVRTEVQWNGCFHYLCRIDVNSSVGSQGLYIATAYVTRAVAWSGPGRFYGSWVVWDVEDYPISLAVGVYASGGGKGQARLDGEHYFNGTLTAIAVGPGGLLAPDALVRVGDMLYAGVTPGYIFTQNSPNGSYGVGGTSLIGDILEPQTLAGAIIPCGAAKFVEVGVLTNTQVTVGAGSDITLGGVKNPMTIELTYAAADASGTRIRGGSPLPGGWGASRQDVVATGQTWDGVSRFVNLDSSAMGAGATFIVPAINTGKGVTDGGFVTIKNEDGVNAVAITPTGGDLIDEVNAPVALGGGGSKAAFDLTVRASTNNYQIS